MHSLRHHDDHRQSVRLIINMASTVSKESAIDISVATNARDLDAVVGILKELNEGAESLRSNFSDELRQDLSTKARDLMMALETPRETSIKHIWGEVGT